MTGDDVTPSRHDVEVNENTSARADRPVYRYELLLSDSFEAVLEGSGRAVDARHAVSTALESGRILLQARGGAGKTETLNRLAAVATEAGVRVVRVWAVAWSNNTTDIGGTVDQNSLLGTLATASEPTTPPTAFADEQRALLLIDGLNEVRAEYVHEVLGVVEVLATRYPQLGVVIADRLARRPVDPSTWQLATLTPVPDLQVREILGPAYDATTAPLFRNPFFLERARLHPATAAINGDFFTSQIGLDPDALRDLASAVNHAYRHHKDRMMGGADVEAAVGSDVLDKLREAGLIERASDRLRFSHHLVSDFLAALDLSDAPERWTRDEFDGLTFRASSFDALTMLLDEAPSDADLLIRRVYDWNLYAAAYMLAEDDVRTDRVSADMRVALLAMLAERRFDPLRATAQQVTDALRLQRTPLAEKLLAARTVNDVFDVVRELEGTSDWFAEWRSLFVGADSEDVDIALLSGPDSVLGWTAANVLKRRRIREDQLRQITSLLKVSPDATVRWRCAHVLGSVVTNATAEALLTQLSEDEDLWVRYGALRSLIEVAGASDAGLRELIFRHLADLADEVVASPQLASEVRRALHLSKPPSDWAENAGVLIEQLWARGRSVAEQDEWRELSAALRRQVEPR